MTAPTTWAAPLLAGDLLLAVAGVGKALRPAAGVRALDAVGVRMPASLVRVGAAAEAGLGAAAAVVGGRWLAGSVALAYAGFAAFIGVALARGSRSACGCFAREAGAPTAMHAVIDGALACAAGAAAVAGGPGPLVAAAHRPGWGVGLVLVATTLAGLVYLVLTELPRLHPADIARP